MHGVKNDKIVEVYKFLKKYILSNGFPPSVREVCNELGIKSTATVYYYFEKLEELGYIKRSKNKFRAIEIIAKDDETQETESNLTIMTDEKDNQYKVSSNLFNGTNLFIQTIQTESDLDLIVCEKKNEIISGEKVLVNIDGNKEIKTYTLDMLNERIEILGVVKGEIKKY